jgi:hypothetical protein
MSFSSIILVVLAAIIVLFLFCKRRLIKRLLLIFQPKYRKNPRKSPLSSAQQSALNIGAILSVRNRNYMDSIETGESKGEKIESMAEWWGVYSTDSAIETLEWLFDEGHRVHYNGSYLQPDVLSYDKNMNATLEVLIKNQIIADKSDLNNISILAWDMGRSVNVARWCFDCGYITKEKAWNYINRAHTYSKQIYNSWEEFSTGYIVGRAMWSGDPDIVEDVIYDVQSLLNDVNSPWKNTSIVNFSNK